MTREEHIQQWRSAVDDAFTTVLDLVHERDQLEAYAARVEAERNNLRLVAQANKEAAEAARREVNERDCEIERLRQLLEKNEVQW